MSVRHGFSLNIYKKPLVFTGRKWQNEDVWESQTFYVHKHVKYCVLVKYKAPHLICLKKAAAFCCGLLLCEKAQKWVIG